MRSFRHKLIVAFVLTVMLLPTVVYAAGPYYASTTGDVNGTGTGTDPRRAVNAQQLAAACDYFADDLGLGETATVYWVIIAGGNSLYYTYELDAGGDCTVTAGPKPNTPPGFGVTLPPPVIVGGLIVVGLLLVLVAWFLRNRFSARRPLT